MSLRHFLPIGRAFVTAGDRVGRYRPAEAGAVPDFSTGSGRNRGEATVFSGGGVTEVTSVPPVDPAAPVARPGTGTGTVFGGNEVLELAVGTGDGVGRKISVEPSLSRPLPAPAATVAGAGDLGRVRAGWGGWAAVGRLLGAMLRPGNRRRGTRVVQTEMAFDRVRVARNDLMTSDVEVVALGAKGAERPARLSAACRARLLVLWWDQGAERVRRLGNVFRKK